MSTNWSLRSYGRPYFAMEQPDRSGMAADGLHTYGIVNLGVDFRVFAMPTRKASDSENHVFASVADLHGARLLEVGVTPLGALAVQGKAGIVPTFTSAQGLIYPDGRWHYVEATFDVGTGFATLVLDGNLLLSAAGTPGNLTPTSVALVRLFNGADALARTDLAIRSAVLSTSDGQARVCTYNFLEKSGSALAGTKDDGDFPLVSSFDLAARWMVPLSYALPWGDVPNTGLMDAFRWTLATEYEEVLVAAPDYEEVDVL